MSSTPPPAVAQPGGRLAYELARVLPPGGAADAAAGASGHADPGQRRHGAAATAAHRDTDGPAVQRHASTPVWPAWVQRCGFGSSCGCAPQDQMAGVQRDVQRAITGAGAPLQPGVLSRMGSAFSADFSAVRVHTGSAADEVASKLKAHALTAGPDIVFRGGAYSPGTQSGDRLLAHELSHVVQQRDGVVRAAVDGGPSDPLERAADAAADNALRAVPSTLAPAGAGVGYLHGVGGSAGTAGNSPAQRRRDDRAQGGEDQQAAGRADEGGKWASVCAAAASPVTVQRDATLGALAAPALGWAVDDLADYIAHDLDAYAARHPKPYAHILEVFKKLDPDVEDNVAAAFTKLQPSARLEEFAKDPQGLAVLDVLTEAMITGSVSLFEGQQAERILIAKRKPLPAGEYAAQADRIAELRHRAAPAFSEDDRARQIATDLNAYVANDLYEHVLGVFADLPSSIEDNVAAAFMEQQPDEMLEHFADTWLGYLMLQVLYDALITGNVSSFESVQAERILIAEAKSKWKWVTPGQYVSEAERIARLRDRAEDSPGEIVLDAVATETAHVLNDAVAQHRYSYVAKTIGDLSSGFLSSGTADNVASHFIELQTPARLEGFAADHEGRAMLNVLYEAMITGKVSAFERMQAERILAATRREPTLAALEALKDPPVFPLASRWGTGATIVARLLSNGQVEVFYQKRTGLDEFSQEIATLTRHYGPDALAGMILDPDLLVVVKLYDQGGVMVPVPAIKLIDLYNQQQEDWLGKVKTVTFLAATVGVGGIGAGGIVGWADTITVALSAGSLFVNAYRDEIAKTPLGQLFLTEWDIAEGIAEYYNWARLGVDGLQLIHAKVGTAFEDWRQENPSGLTPAERETTAMVRQHIEPWLDAVKQAETPAAEKYLQEHPPKKVEGEPGSRHAEIEGNHKLKEVSGGLGCEFSSDPTPVHCDFGKLGHTEPPKPEEPAKPSKPEEPAEGPAATTTKESAPTAAAAGQLTMTANTLAAELNAARDFYPGHRGQVGSLLTPGRRPMRIKSGVEGGPWGGTQRGSIPRGKGYGFTSGGSSQGNIATHVEGHSAAIMHQQNITEATLVMGAEQCTICARDLPAALPAGSELTVITVDPAGNVISSDTYRSSHAF